MKRRAAAVALVIAGLAFSALPAQAAPIEITPSAPEPAAAPDSQTILVTLDAAGSDPEAAAQAVVSKAADAIDGAEISDVRRVTKTTVAVTLSGGVTTSEADQVAAKVDDQRNVKTANTALTFHPAETDWESSLWNINSFSKYGVAADRAWNLSMGAGVIVGVLDSGITANPDLDANVIAGYDFIDADMDPTDDSVGTVWHGTHVAGTIAAVKNSSGIVGVAPSSKVEPIRVLSADSGSEADVITAIRWAVGDPVAFAAVGAVNPSPVQVLNLSLGGDGACSPQLQEAIDYAVFSKGVPVVVAAGNADPGKPLYTFSPANCANVIRVTATTYTGTWADYSNYGDYWDPATIAAPGGSGYSTYCPNGAGQQCGGVLSTVKIGAGASDTDYDFMYGTSMAAPHVSGVLALLRAIHPEWTVAQLTAAVRGSATPVAKCSSVDCGAGIVNAAGAVSITNFITQLKAPSISGKFKVGKTLKVKSGKWSPKVKVTYRWLRNGRPISKATKSTYKLTKKDKAKWVSVQVTVIGPAGYARQIVVPTAHQVKR